MSTDYYRLKEPITSIQAEILGGHTHVGIWVNHAKSGTLVFRNEEWKEAIWLFRDGESLPPMHSHWGGVEAGTIVTSRETLPDEQQLLSEYGELLSVKDIKSRHGSKRKDGWPTELFGFEEEIK